MKWWMAPPWFFGCTLAVIGGMTNNWYVIAVGGIIAISAGVS